MWEEKKSKRQKLNQDENDQDKKQNADYELHSYSIGSKQFEEYYRAQFRDIIPDDEEFQKMYKTLQDKLPVTFRVNPSLVNYEAMVEMFQDPEFVKKYWIEPAEKETTLEGQLKFYGS